MTTRLDSIIESLTPDDITGADLVREPLLQELEQAQSSPQPSIQVGGGGQPTRITVKPRPYSEGLGQFRQTMGLSPVETPPPSEPTQVAKEGHGFLDYVAQSFAKSIADLVTTPQRAYRQGLTPEEEIGFGSGMALNMLGMGAPIAKPGSAGLFGGQLSGAADLIALSKAEKMAKKGIDRETIWEKTGWFKGEDGKWRFEISDEQARIAETAPVEPASKADWTAVNPDVDRLAIPLGDPRPISEIITHPEAMAAYPGLKGPTRLVERNTSGAYGSFDQENYTFSLAPGSTEQALSTLLHEMQHYVQDREGFDTGGNTWQFTPLRADTLKIEFAKQELALNKSLESLNIAPYKADGIVKLIEQYGTVPENVRAGLEIEIQTLAQHPDLVRKVQALEIARKNFAIIELHAWHNYARLAGELEARTVQARQKMTGAERKAEPPWVTQERLLSQLPEEYRQALVQVPNTRPQ